MDRPINRRIWISAAIATPLLTGSALSSLLSMGQGIVVGELLGLPGRESDVAFAQHWAANLLLGSFCLLAGAIITMTFALPFYADASRIPRTIARFDTVRGSDASHRVHGIPSHQDHRLVHILGTVLCEIA